MISIDELDRKLYGDKVIKIYGPYERKEDNRSHIALYTGDTTWTISYPKYLMERKLGRRLEKDETVDHINNYPPDNEQYNLQVLSRADNIRKSNIKVKVIICPCGTEFKQKRTTQSYCSNKCRHKYAKTH